MAGAFRVYLAGHPARQTLWPGAWHLHAAEMLRHDLAAAGIPYRDAEGHVFDFHGLRHSYITLLSLSGVSPKLAQELARHSTIDLTMNVYTHLLLNDKAAAVASLPALLPGSQPEAKPLRQTGTDTSKPVDASCSPVAVTGAGTCLRLLSVAAEGREDGSTGDTQKPLEN